MRLSSEAAGAAIALVCALLVASCWRGTWYLQSQAGGTWRADKELERAASAVDCAFARVDGRKHSREDFELFHREQHPLLIEGLLEQWPARVTWSKKNLQNKYAERKIWTGRGNDIVHGGGVGGTQISLSSRLGLLDGQINASEPEMFSFDVDFFSSVPELKNDFQTPSLFSGFDNAQSIRNQLSWHIVSLGPSRTGLPFHVHGETWLGLVFGMKWWFVYPPGAPVLSETCLLEPDLFNPLHSVWKWFQIDLPRIQHCTQSSPLQCIQKPGEVLYLPSGWKHLTLNVGDAIAVGGQGWYSPSKRLKMADTVLKVNPLDFDAFLNAGEAHANFAIGGRAEDGSYLTDQQVSFHFDMATTNFQRALALKPLHLATYCLLAEVFFVSGHIESVQVLLHTAASEFDHFLEGQETDLSALSYLYFNLGYVSFFALYFTFLFIWLCRRIFLSCSLFEDAALLYRKAHSLDPHSTAIVDELNQVLKMIQEL